MATSNDSNSSISTARFDFIGTPVVVDADFIAELLAMEEDDDEVKIVPDLQEEGCMLCYLPSTSEGDIMLITCSNCDANMCRPCLTSNLAQQLNDGRAPETLGCVNCGSRSPIEELVRQTQTTYFPHLWKSRKCPVCGHRNEKDRGENNIECENCRFLSCAWCKHTFRSTYVDGEHLTNGKYSCYCNKLRDGMKRAVKYGACAFALPMVIAGLTLVAPGAAVYYSTSSTEDRNGMKSRLKRTFTKFRAWLPPSGNQD